MLVGRPGALVAACLPGQAPARHLCPLTVCLPDSVARQFLVGLRRLQALLARRGIFRSPSFQLEGLVVCISVTHRVTSRLRPAPGGHCTALGLAGNGWDFLGLPGTGRGRCCPGWGKSRVDRTRRLRVFCPCSTWYSVHALPFLRNLAHSTSCLGR